MTTATGRTPLANALRTDYSDGNPDIEKPFYLLKHTYCAAVLTENGVMDSEVSLSFLESEEDQKAIVTLHAEGIISFVEGKECFCLLSLSRLSLAAAGSALFIVNTFIDNLLCLLLPGFRKKNHFSVLTDPFFLYLCRNMMCL